MTPLLARSFLRFASAAAGIVGSVVAPAHCAACELEVPENVLFCPSCAASVESVDPWSDRSAGCIAAFDYGGAIATAIARLKYEDRPDLAPRLARSVLVAAQRAAGAVDLVIPVPLHPRRLAERGYNQAALLAAPLARSLSVTMAPLALARLRDTPRQAKLDRRGRIANVVHAFRTRERSLVRGTRVLIVDDVRTTGATLEACAVALHEAGARQIMALVVASRTRW